MRKVVVVSSDTQTKVTFETEAQTVAELLTELDSRNVNYQGKQMFEGISHSTINQDIPDGVLPHDNLYRGTVTNDLAIVITSGKKIDSGMLTRAELYQKVKELGLVDAVREHFGINYTNVSSQNLMEFIEANSSKTKKNSDAEEKEDACTDYCPLAALFAAMIKIAVETDLLPAPVVIKALSDAGAIKLERTQSKEEVESPVSDEDLEAMLRDFVG